MGLSIGLSSKWVQKDGECLICLICMDQIFGKRYNLELTIGPHITETDSNLCEPCYTKMIENDDSDSYKAR